MSTNRSVGRLTATQEKVRPTATQVNDLSAVTHKKDRSNLCAFTFADGRRCRTPRRSGHPHLCYFHAQRKRKPSPQNRPVRTYLPSFQQICSPLAILAPPWLDSSPRLPAAM
jgi:hypothetical protein